MERRGSPSEYEVTRRAVARAAHEADREIRRRALEAPFGCFEIERWLRFVVQHPELGEDGVLADAEALLLGRYGWWLWCELGDRVSRGARPAAHAVGLARLLDDLRSGSDGVTASPRRAVREVAREVAGEFLGFGDGDEGQGRR